MTKMLARLCAFACGLFVATALLAQGAIQQVGPVTPGHIATWWQNGQIYDGGAIPNLINPNIWTAKQTFGPLTNGQAPINIVPGAAPSAPIDGDLWTTSAGVFARINGVSQGPLTYAGMLNNWTAKQTFAASTTVGSGVNLAPGVAPTSPLNGDVWTTGAGLYARINGSTQGPFSATGAFNVSTYGALGTGSGSAAVDTAAFQAAITAACATATHVNPNGGGVVELDVPVPPVGYYINAPLTLCSNLHIHGVGGYSTIVFTPSGTPSSPTELFLNSGQRAVEIDHLDINGQYNAYAFAYRAVTNAASALNVRIHDNLFYSWGNGSSLSGSGAALSIESDSARNSIYDNFIVARHIGIWLSAATDGLHVYDNYIISGDVSDTSTCIFSTGGSGAATAFIQHNLLGCDGGGAMMINNNMAMIVTDNEEENLNGITNADSTVYDIKGASIIQFINNFGNAHLQSNYTFYVSDTIANSMFSNNISAPVNSTAWRVGSGSNNGYWANIASQGPAFLYSADYNGIISNSIPPGQAMAIGCGATMSSLIYQNFTLCDKFVGVVPSTASSINAGLYTPALGVGNFADIIFGVANTTNNAAQIAFINTGGAGSSSNTLSLGVVNGSQVTISAAGNVKAASYNVGATAGVSCSGAPTGSFASINGIVTHC